MWGHPPHSIRMLALCTELLLDFSGLFWATSLPLSAPLSYLGSGALCQAAPHHAHVFLVLLARKWMAVTAIHPLRCPPHSPRGLPPYACSPSCVGALFALLRLPQLPLPTLMHWDLLHSVTPNATQIFNFEVYPQMPFRKALTTNVGAPVSPTSSTMERVSPLADLCYFEKWKVKYLTVNWTVFQKKVLLQKTIKTHILIKTQIYDSISILSLW